jgi:hypothetical protein
MINYNNIIDKWSIRTLMLEYTSSFINSENDEEKDNYTKRFFNQLQYLSNKFDINFNNIFNQYRN